MHRNSLRAAREAKGMTIEELAKAAGLPQKNISEIEQSKQEPSLQMALHLAKALNTAVEQLFTEREDNGLQSDLRNQLIKYQDLLDFIFGSGVCTIDVNQSGINNLVGAITYERDSTFDSFRVNYIERLRRLISIYEKDPESLKTISRLAKEVGSKNGGGAYAELGALDFFARMHTKVISTPPTLDVNIPASKTFAKAKPQRQFANLDGYIEELNTYFDVKSLQDVTDSILQKPLHELSHKYGAHILTERDYPYDYAQLKIAINDVTKELDIALSSKETFLKVRSLEGLSFRIGWSPGVLHTTGVHDPYKDALIRHKGIFDYGDKFVQDSPFVLVLTAVPWTHNLSGFMDADNTFFRALSRRVFCQYIGSLEVHPKFGVTFEELSKSISLIVFLQLHDTLGKEQEVIQASVFANPNANHPCSGLMRNFLNEQRVAIQDFESDNY